LGSKCGNPFVVVFGGKKQICFLSKKKKKPPKRRGSVRLRLKRATDFYAEAPTPSSRCKEGGEKNCAGRKKKERGKVPPSW